MSGSRYEQPVDLHDPDRPFQHSVPLIGFNKRVLEFGCAAGHVTRVLADRGCRVTGIEIDPEAARVARECAEDVLVVDLDVDDFVDKLAGEQFDVIVFLDVLEHLRDPLRVLRAARTLLAPGGYAVICVPNVTFADVRFGLIQGRFEYQPWGLLDSTHLRFFTADSLERMVREAGFVIVELRRQLMPAFSSSIDVDRQALAQSTIDDVFADPEAETFQFVVKAVFDDALAVEHRAIDRCRELESELAEVHLGTEARLVALTTRAEQAEAVLEVMYDRNTDAERRVRELHAAVAAAHEKLISADAEIHSVHTRLGGALADLGHAEERIQALSIRGRLRRLTKPLRRKH